MSNVRYGLLCWRKSNNKKYVNDINIQTNSVLGCIQYKKHVDSGKKLKIEIN